MAFRLTISMLAAALALWIAPHDAAAKAPRVVTRAHVIEVAEVAPAPQMAPATLAPRAEPMPPVAPPIVPPTQAPSDVLAAPPSEHLSMTERFYRARGNTLAWLDPAGQPRRRAKTAVTVLAHADGEGLDPADYDVAGLADALRAAHQRGLAAGDAAALDRRITQSVLRYAHDLAAGRVNPARADISAQRTNEGIDVGQILDSAIARRDVRSELARLAPRHDEYVRLRDALPRYRAIVQAGGWPRVETTAAKLEPGKRYSPDTIEALQERLRAEGFLDGATVRAGSVVYDNELAAGVRRFQGERSMQVDGVLGRNTLTELNRPAAEIVTAIKANMERWRWLPRDFASRHIRADIPSFELHAYDGGHEALGMRIIAGQRDWNTPIFSDQIDYVVLNPNWHVPKRIAAEEILPRLIADPSYLESHDMDLIASDKTGQHVVDPVTFEPASIDAGSFPYRLRQRPGPRNPLGRVKFVMPNRFDVYLHDTPNTWLFKGHNRALSHGCIRVEHPVDLATWVLSGEPKWAHDDIVQAIDSKDRHTVTLTQPVPVYVTYVTASVGDDGRLRMHPDIYGFDTRIAEVLDGAPRSDVSASAAE